ncbi:uncharacterized protein METZ01_LOCUS59135 [marine metagenome]|uniref:Uncharacterized protein n=1 Tax=marine metagenome TaxID=408172 RepID=A0A381SSK0_9ZZZZ
MTALVTKNLFQGRSCILTGLRLATKPAGKTHKGWSDISTSFKAKALARLNFPKVTTLTRSGWKPATTSNISLDRIFKEV